MTKQVLCISPTIFTAQAKKRYDRDHILWAITFYGRSI